MRLTLTIILLLLANYTCYSQKTVEDYYLKKTLKQDGLQINFLVLEDDKRGVIFYNKNKFYHWYEAQKMIATQGGASGALLHGDFESFYTNKQLESQGDFNRGLRNGEWLYWRENGTLIQTESWKKGKKVGWEKWYNEKGEVFQTMKHKCNNTIRENNDSIVEIKNDGVIQIISIKDNENNVKQIISRKNGKLHGASKTFDNGKLILTQKYKNGELISEKSNFMNTDKRDSKKKWWQIFKKKNANKEGEIENSESIPKQDNEIGKKEKKSKIKKEKNSRDEPKSEL